MNSIVNKDTYYASKERDDFSKSSVGVDTDKLLKIAEEMRTRCSRDTSVGLALFFTRIAL